MGPRVNWSKEQIKMAFSFENVKTNEVLVTGGSRKKEVTEGERLGPDPCDTHKQEVIHQ